MVDAAGRVEALIRAIRAAFGALRALGDELHRDLGVSAAMRAVMEHLAEEGAATVPEIARAKKVSRQNIQVLVDALAAAALVESRDNPAHRRSPHIVLSDRGRTVFRTMRRRERALLAALAAGLPADAIERATATLKALVGGVEALAPASTTTTELDHDDDD